MPPGSVHPIAYAKTVGGRTPLQAMNDWHKLKPELIKKRPYHLPGCDT